MKYLTASYHDDAIRDNLNASTIVPTTINSTTSDARALFNQAQALDTFPPLDFCAESTALAAVGVDRRGLRSAGAIHRSAVSGVLGSSTMEKSRGASQWNGARSTTVTSVCTGSARLPPPPPWYEGRSAGAHCVGLRNGRAGRAAGGLFGTGVGIIDARAMEGDSRRRRRAAFSRKVRSKVGCGGRSVETAMLVGKGLLLVLRDSASRQRARLKASYNSSGCGGLCPGGTMTRRLRRLGSGFER